MTEVSAHLDYPVLFANETNDVAFGRVTLGNLGDRPIAITEMSGELRVENESGVSEFVVVFEPSRLRLEPLEEAKILIYTYLKGLEIPAAVVFPMGHTANVEDGEPVMVFDATISGPQTWWHVFPHGELNALLRLDISNTEEGSTSIEEIVEICELRSMTMGRELLTKDAPFEGDVSLPDHIMLFRNGKVTYYRAESPFLEEDPQPSGHHGDKDYPKAQVVNGLGPAPDGQCRSEVTEGQDEQDPYKF